MAEQIIRRRSWELELSREFRTERSMYRTADENWRATDSNGHEHRWDHGYPTLDQVVDAEHWCDGNEGIMRHDPHRQIDEAHFECRECRELVEPGRHPPGWPLQIPGPVNATLRGRLFDGARTTTVTMIPTDEQVERLQAVMADDAAADALVEEILTAVLQSGDGRVQSIEIAPW